MIVSPARRPGRSVVTAVLAVVWLAAPAFGEWPPIDGGPAVQAAVQAMRDYFTAGKPSSPRACELWLAYARAAGLPERPKDFRRLQASIPAGLRQTNTPDEVQWVLDDLESAKYECPPWVEPGSDAAVRTAPAAKKAGIGSKAVLIGGAAAAVGTGIALAAGSGSTSAAPTTPPPADQPPNVTTLHGLYVGRLVTSSPSIPGCGRAATVGCNAQVGGNTTGTPASLTFGGDLPSSGVLRATGAMEGFRYEGPANGLAALPAGIVVDWRQLGTIANRVLTLDGSATVTSAGPCNGAVITTRVEATRN
jgi:hypothetical protein